MLVGMIPGPREPKDGKMRAVIVGVQITIRPNHKPSESPFISRWQDWAYATVLLDFRNATEGSVRVNVSLFPKTPPSGDIPKAVSTMPLDVGVC